MTVLHTITTKTQAKDFANKCESYWHGEGYNHVWFGTKRILAGNRVSFAIISNLVNGLPPE